MAERGNVWNQLFDEVRRFYLECRTPVFKAVFYITFTLWIFRIWMRGCACNPDVDLTGKTVIVTGANSGIGKETAFILANKGAKVIMACRNLEKAVEAAKEIEWTSKTGSLSVQHLDLASFKSIHRFTKQVLAKEPRIDILINNAGVMASKDRTEDGFEIHFGVNYVGHFLLTNLLLDRIKESAPARIINVASRAHTFAKINWYDLEYKHFYWPTNAYCESKLALVLFTKELGRRLKDTGVTSYAVHPGFIRTNLTRNLYDIFFYPVAFIFDLIVLALANPPLRGAQTTIYCALNQKLDTESGYFYSDCNCIRPSTNFMDSLMGYKEVDEEDAQRLWNVTSDMVEMAPKAKKYVEEYFELDHVKENAL